MKDTRSRRINEIFPSRGTVRNGYGEADGQVGDIDRREWIRPQSHWKSFKATRGLDAASEIRSAKGIEQIPDFRSDSKGGRMGSVGWGDRTAIRPRTSSNPQKFHVASACRQETQMPDSRLAGYRANLLPVTPSQPSSERRKPDPDRQREGSCSALHNHGREPRRSSNDPCTSSRPRRCDWRNGPRNREGPPQPRSRPARGKRQMQTE